MLNNNGSLAVDGSPGALISAVFESFVPSSIAQLLEIFVHDVCRHDRLYKGEKQEKGEEHDKTSTHLNK